MSHVAGVKRRGDFDDTPERLSKRRNDTPPSSRYNDNKYDAKDHRRSGYQPNLDARNNSSRDDRRKRSRSRSPRRQSDRDDRHRARSPPRGPRNDPRHIERPRTHDARETHRGTKSMDVKQEDSKAHDVAANPAAGSDESIDQEEAEMQRVMGFTKFRSTKNTKVPGNDRLYGVRKEKKIEYRQYMNRVGGFNRPLSPSR